MSCTHWGINCFFENNPFDAVKERNDLNRLQKIRALLVLNQSNDKRNHLNMQTVPILKDPHILAAAVEENRRVLTPLWMELLEEGKNDGSIKTEYARELSELLPLINFWLMPTVFPATEEELHHKYRFVMEMLEHMGLPIFDDKAVSFTENFIHDISQKPCGHKVNRHGAPREGRPGRTSMPEKAGDHKEKGGNEP